MLIENCKVGDLKRHGLDYDTLSALNTGLAYCSVTGFGLTGPYPDRPGYDTEFQAMGGLMSTTGLPDGVPGGGPMKTGPSLAEVMEPRIAAWQAADPLAALDAAGVPAGPVNDLAQVFDRPAYGGVWHGGAGGGCRPAAGAQPGPLLGHADHRIPRVAGHRRRYRCGAAVAAGRDGHGYHHPARSKDHLTGPKNR